MLNIRIDEGRFAIVEGILLNADPGGDGRRGHRADDGQRSTDDSPRTHRQGDLGFAEVDLFERRAGCADQTSAWVSRRVGR